MIWWGVTLPNAHLVALEVSEGDVPPSEAGKFCIFEIGNVQIDEYFRVQV